MLYLFTKDNKRVITLVIVFYMPWQQEKHVQSKISCAQHAFPAELLQHHVAALPRWEAQALLQEHEQRRKLM
jgi:hypothetical protein